MKHLLGYAFEIHNQARKLRRVLRLRFYKQHNDCALDVTAHINRDSVSYPQSLPRHLRRETKSNDQWSDP